MTLFCLWLKSSQKSCLARTACRHLGGYSDQVVENSTSQHFRRPHILAKCEELLWHGHALSCIAGDAGDQSRVALLAASNLISQITSIKRSYRNSRDGS